MAHRQATARPGRDRERDSGYTENERPMPTAGEDRMESIYRNPVGAQSDMPLEGQHKVGNARPDTNDGRNHRGKSRKKAA